MIVHIRKLCVGYAKTSSSNNVSENRLMNRYLVNTTLNRSLIVAGYEQFMHATRTVS